MATLSIDKLIFPANLILLNKRNRDEIPLPLFSQLDAVSQECGRLYTDALPIQGEDLASFHIRVNQIQINKSFNMSRHILLGCHLLNTFDLCNGQVSRNILICDLNGYH